MADRRSVTRRGRLSVRRTMLAVVAVVWSLGATVPAAPAAQKYSSFGAFALAGKPEDVNTVFEWQGVVADPATGLPKVVYDDGVAHWNPTTVALWGLQEFNRFIVFDRRQALPSARRAGNWLVANQRSDGSWRHTVRFTPYRFGPIEPGWVAAQTQGNAISLLVRLHAATGDRRYLRTARRARRPYERPFREGGLRRRFNGHRLLEGFPTAVPSFPLEDLQLAILGLYDLSHHDRAARRLFREHTDALVAASPYYEDADGRPYFDLGHCSAGVSGLYYPEAHTFNAQTLALLGKLSGNRAARRIAKRWARIPTGAAAIVPTFCTTSPPLAG